MSGDHLTSQWFLQSTSNFVNLFNFNKWNKITSFICSLLDIISLTYAVFILQTSLWMKNLWVATFTFTSQNFRTIFQTDPQSTSFWGIIFQKQQIVPVGDKNRSTEKIIIILHILHVSSLQCGKRRSQRMMEWVQAAHTFCILAPAVGKQSEDCHSGPQPSDKPPPPSHLLSSLIACPPGRMKKTKTFYAIHVSAHPEGFLLEQMWLIHKVEPLCRSNQKKHFHWVNIFFF